MGSNIDQSLKSFTIGANDMSFFAIPGLGVDGRIYRRLSKHIPNLEILEWLEPLEKESLSEYAKRMAAPIAAKTTKPILIGTSFGGIVAQEMAQIIEVERLILISTIKAGDKKPWYFPIASSIPIYQLMKGKLRYRLLPYWAPFVGISDPEEQVLLQSMFMNASVNHRLWGAGKVVNWDAPEINVPFIHLHGERDRVFASQNIKGAHVIQGSGHFMVYQQADTVARLVKKWLTSDPKKSIEVNIS